MWRKQKKLVELTVPRHVAFIMDGNGRWAQKRRLPRLAGHKAGVDALKRIVKASSEIGIEYVTVYAFSTENWNRPAEEVTGLMELIVFFLKRDLNELIEQKVKIMTIGDLTPIPEEALREIRHAMQATDSNEGLKLIIALNYGGRQEIVHAAKHMAVLVQRGDLKPEEIDDTLFQSFLETKGLPDPDLVVRSSGEMRVSNFMLWQASYAEYYFTETLWPDFNKAHLLKALESYSARDRRFGKVK